MISFLSLLSLLLGITTIGVLGWAFYLYKNQSFEVEDNDDIALNFLSYKNDKRFLGSYVNETKSIPGRLLIKYKPRGLDLRSKKYNQYEILDKVKQQTAIVEEGKRITIPKGILEQDKAIHILLPPNAKDFPTDFQDTTLGRALMWATEEENAKKSIVQMLEEGKIRRADIMQMIGDGEFSREWAAMMEEKAKDALKSIVADKDRKDKSPLSINSRGYDGQIS